MQLFAFFIAPYICWAVLAAMPRRFFYSQENNSIFIHKTRNSTVL